MRAHDAEDGRLAGGLRAHVVEVPGGGGGGGAAGEGVTPAVGAPLQFGLIGLVESERLATLATRWTETSWRAPCSSQFDHDH